MAAFKKGQSGNPTGRPKIVLADGRSLRDMAREHTEEAMLALLKVMRSETAPASAIAQAAQAIHDRGWGKPTQPLSGDDEAPPIRHELDTAKLSEAVLRELAAQG